VVVALTFPSVKPDPARIDHGSGQKVRIRFPTVVIFKGWRAAKQVLGPGLCPTWMGDRTERVVKLGAPAPFTKAEAGLPRVVPYGHPNFVICMLPSTTKTFPLPSTATPVGLTSCPSPLP